MTMAKSYVSFAAMNKPFAPDGHAPPGGFTAGEYLRMLDLGAFEDMTVELVGGYLQRMTPANFDHSAIHASVIAELGGAVRETGLRLAADLAVQIDAFTVRGIDVAIVLPDRTSKRPIDGGDVMLAVEVADATLARDVGPKLIDYARAGIPNYWVIDVKGRIIQVMSDPGTEGYAKVEVVRFGEPLAIPGVDRVITVG